MQKLNSRSRSTVFAAENLANYTMSNMLLNVISLANALNTFSVSKLYHSMARDVCGCGNSSSTVHKRGFVKNVITGVTTMLLHWFCVFTCPHLAHVIAGVCCYYSFYLYYSNYVYCFFFERL